MVWAVKGGFMLCVNCTLFDDVFRVVDWLRTQKDGVVCGDDP